MNNKVLLFVFFFVLLCISDKVYSQQQQSGIVKPTQIDYLRDSLDAIQYSIPELPVYGRLKIITIKTQEKWDALDKIIEDELGKGISNIEIRLKGRELEYGNKNRIIKNLNYKNANIRIVGSRAKMNPYGRTFSSRNKKSVQQGDFYTFPYYDFDINDIVIDNKGNEVPFREDVRQVDGNIEHAKQLGIDIWRFKTDLPDLNEKQCKDFYVLITRDWTSARHKVIKVENSWLYFHLDSEDLHSDLNPNRDWERYRVRPRYRYINNPQSEGLHVVNDRIYIPKQYKQIRIIKSGCLLSFEDCSFNSLEISGFSVNGSGGSDSPLSINNCKFRNGLFIHDNVFRILSAIAIKSSSCENVAISNNTISETREQAILGWGNNVTINNNQLMKIGWMLNTRAITGGGDCVHICDNIIEDFNYAAIACGSATPNAKAQKLTYIIERNYIKLSNTFTEDYIKNTLADGGGIYIGPQCTQGIIRHNVVENIKGIGINKGIYLDDGAKNLAIYGNLVMGIANSYDIDLRYSESYSDGIPDHNTNNSIFHNIITGYYRFQNKDYSSHCVGGQNLILNSNQTNKIIVKIDVYEEDITENRAIIGNKRVLLPKDYNDLLKRHFDPFVQQFISTN